MFNFFGFGFGKTESQTRLEQIIESANNVSELCSSKLLPLLAERKIKKGDVIEFRQEIEGIYKVFIQLMKYIIIGGAYVCESEAMKDKIIDCVTLLHLIMVKIQDITSFDYKKIIKSHLKYLVQNDKNIEDEKKNFTINKIAQMIDALESPCANIIKKENNQKNEIYESFIDLIEKINNTEFNGEQ